MVRFDVQKLEVQISAAIELARLADMCKKNGLEAQMARNIRKTLIANPNPEPNHYLETCRYQNLPPHIATHYFGIIFAATAPGPSHYGGSLGGRIPSRPEPQARPGDTGVSFF